MYTVKSENCRYTLLFIIWKYITKKGEPDMKSHITKVVAMLMAVLMLISLVPAAALPDLTLPDLQSVTVDGEAEQDNTSADSSDETPADDSASENGVLTEEQIAALENAQVSDEEYFSEVVSGVVLGKDVVTDDTDYHALNYGEDGKTIVPADENTSPYEPAKTNNEDDPFLTDGDAWIDLSKIHYGSPATPTIAFSEWSANTTFQNTSGVYYRDDDPTTPEDETLQVQYYIFPDVDLIHENLWGQTKASLEEGQKLPDDNYQIGNDTEGYAYNRYDPQQGKWGVTIDKNRTLTTWTLGENGEGIPVDMTTNSHLMFSTEQAPIEEDENGNVTTTVKMSIAIEIGTPVYDAATGDTSYEYRWYTITDDNPHPDITSVDSGTQIPDVTISTDVDGPVHNNTTYIDNALTGCIDMTYWLPFVKVPEDGKLTTGEDGVDFKTYMVRSVSVSTPEENTQACRINYLYFLSPATSFMGPQANTGNVDLDSNGSVAADETGWYGSQFLTVTEGDSADIDTTDADSTGLVEVTVPIRKWVNAAKDGRRLDFKLVTNSSTSSTGQKPIISIWGNNEGYINTVGGFDAYGVYSNENCLFVSGGNGETETPYLLPRSGNGDLKYASVDFSDAYKQYMQFMDHNDYSNWYDFLYSPGVDSNMITEYTDYDATGNPNMYGWIYISSVRLILPGGGKYSYVYGNLTPNSATLNTKDQVADGGMGVEPNVNLNTYQNNAAAYGPLLADSDPYDGSKEETSLLPQYSHNVYGKLATITNNNRDVCVATTFVRAEHLDEPQYEGDIYNTGDDGFHELGDEGAVVLLGTLTTNGVDYYYISYNGGFYWVNGWACEVTPVTGQENYPNLVGGTGAAGLGTPIVEGSTITGHNKDSAYGYYQWLRADNSELDGTNDANGMKATFTEDGYTLRMDAMANGGENSFFRELTTPYELKESSYLQYSLGTTVVEEGASLKVALTVSIDGTDKLVYLVKDTDKTAKLVLPDGGTTVEHTVGGTYEGFIDVGEFMTAVGAEDTVTVKKVHVQSSGKVALDLSLFELKPRNTYGEIEIGEDANGDEIIGESYNIIADAFYGNKVTGTQNDNLESNGVLAQGTVNTKEKAEDAAVEHSYYVNNNGNGGFSTKYGAHNGWILDMMSEHTQMKANASASGSYPCFNPTLGNFSFGVSSEWGRVLFSRKDDEMPTDEYRYLYFSGSVRDNEDNLGAAEDRTIDVNSTGAKMMLFIVDGSNKIWYYKIDTKTFVMDNDATYTKDGTTRTFAGNIDGDYASAFNIAVDLYAAEITSLKSVGVVTHNYTGSTVDYHLNYCYISNNKVSKGYQETVSEREYVHHFYMMDNNVGRFATRFPVFNNPTGQVSSDADRVNPMKFKRGTFFYEGSFYNGLPLDNMYKMNADGTLAVEKTEDANGNVTSAEYIEVYDEATVPLDDRLRAVWFYDYELSKLYAEGVTGVTTASGRELQTIKYYYEFDPTDDGTENLGKVHANYKDETPPYEFKAVWGYSRWPDYTDTNNANSQHYGYYERDGAEDPSGAAGDIPGLYATGNNCLVRSGLVTKKFRTTFITNGGQMNYKGSSGIENGVIANTDNRYITQSEMMNYYNWPTDVDEKVVTPFRYGYTFDGWYSVDDADGDLAKGSDDTSRIARYHTKMNDGEDVFYAHWTKNASDAAATYGDGTPATDAEGNAITWGDLVNTLTFMNFDGTAVYTTRTGKYANNFANVIPNTLTVADASGTRNDISGWAIDMPDPETGKYDGKYDPEVEGASDRYFVFTPGQAITITGNITLVPVPATADGEQDPVRVKITLSGATLEVKTKSGAFVPILEDNDLNITVTMLDVEGETTTTYVNVPRNLIVRAVPTASYKSAAAADGVEYGWQLDNTLTESATSDSEYKREMFKAGDSILSFVSTNEECYVFAAHTDMDIAFAKYYDAANEEPNKTQVATNIDSHGAVISTYTDARLSGSQMKIYSQYQLPEAWTETVTGENGVTTEVFHDVQLIQAGTMYASVDKVKGWATDSTLTEDEAKLASGETQLKNMIVTWKTGSGVGVAQDASYTDIVVCRQKVYDVAFLPCEAANDMQQYYFMMTNKTSASLTAYTRAYVVYWIDLNGDKNVDASSDESTNEVIITYSNYVAKTTVPGVTA